jgi:hypothetical protein
MNKDFYNTYVEGLEAALEEVTTAFEQDVVSGRGNLDELTVGYIQDRLKSLIEQKRPKPNF